MIPSIHKIVLKLKNRYETIYNCTIENGYRIGVGHIVVVKVTEHLTEAVEENIIDLAKPYLVWFSKE